MTDRTTLIQPATLRIERLLPGPAERVWQYIIDAKKRASWFAGGEFELRLGGRVELLFAHACLSAEKETPEKHKGADGARFEGVITRLEQHRALAYSWNMGGAQTEVLFELTPKGKDTLLSVTHRQLDDRNLRLNVAAGWDVHTGILEDVLRGVTPRPFWSTHARLETQYAASL